MSLASGVVIDGRHRPHPGDDILAANDGHQCNLPEIRGSFPSSGISALMEEIIMRPISLAVSTLALFAGTASAQMADVDTDGDGMASYEEVVAVYPEVTEEDFSSMDTDGSGTLDETEMTAAMEAGQLGETDQ